jgi:hypothetical protein
MGFLDLWKSFKQDSWNMPQNKLKRERNFGQEGQFPGTPGYRTREGRSGLDPIESNLEAAYMEGTFYRNLFTLKIRTRNIFYLILMFIFGVLPFIGFTYLIGIGFYESPQNMNNPALWFILVLFLLLVPGAITVNFLLSILEILKLIPPLHRRPKKAKEVKKKMPRRRKDFK